MTSRAFVAMLMTMALLWTGTAAADATNSDRLIIATRAEPNSIDPQFSIVGTNQATAMHVFDTLFTRNADLELVPALAVSAERIDPLTWELELRADVRFHDGSPFDADDVVFSLERAAHVPFSPAPFAGRVAKLASVEAVAPLRVRLRTHRPEPQLMTDIATVFMVSHRIGADVTTSDFNAGTAAIGTGPYRFVSWQHGDRLVLERWDGYWGDSAAFRHVTIRFITSDAARIAALESGSVDLIDTVPPADLDRLERNPAIQLFRSPTMTLLYLGLDVDRARNPSVRGPREPGWLGRRRHVPMTTNPLKDARVREAISLAIDRELLIAKVLGGAGVSANQMVPRGAFGFNAAMPPLAHDPARARALLAEAGYADGFALTLHAPNNRYLNDSIVAQAIGAMLARIGLEMEIDAMPRNVFLPRATQREFGFFLYGFGSVTGESLIALRSVLGSFDPALGTGASNRGRYSNPEFDRLILAAQDAETDAELAHYLERAAAIAFGEFGIVPLYHQMATWASRPGLAFDARRDERTLAHAVRPAEGDRRAAFRHSQRREAQ
jgi:peptide/nickel transport system substrate-binding protein